MKKELILKYWNTFIILLSAYTVIEFLIEIVTKIPEHELLILEAIDLTICIVFLFDWFYFFAKSHYKKRYAYIHSLDFISSIPFAQFLRPFRIVRAARIIRILRLTRGFKGISRFLEIFAKNKARSIMTIYLSITLIIYFYCTLGIYTFEIGQNKNINSFGDVMWMAFTTLTTVGYGDCYPVTAGGRILCGLLVIIGLGLFSLIIAEFATYILSAVNKYKEKE